MIFKTLYFNDKKYHLKWFSIVFIIFIIGIFLGSLYCVTLDNGEFFSVNSYLKSFFTKVKNTNQHIEILKSSLINSIKLSTVIFLFSFIKPGILVIFCSVLIKGFTLGFTYSSFIKLYKLKGLFLCLFNLPSSVISLFALLLLSSGAVIFSLNRNTREKSKIRQFILLSICCLAIFCVASFGDAFISTTFMKLYAPKILK